MSPWTIDEIQTALDGLEWDFPAEAAEQYQRYLGEIRLFNRKIGLVKADDRQLLHRHLMDSLIPLPQLSRAGVFKQEGDAVDVGSGGGFPGIPLAIAYPGYRFSLVERSGRKAGFLQNAVAMLGIAGRVEVLQQDIFDLEASYDVAVSRAFKPLSQALPILISRLRTGGQAAVYAGRRETVEAELEAAQEALDGVRVDIYPVASGERSLVCARPS